MIAQVRSAVVLGVEGHPVRVEVHVSRGLPSFTVVGLPDASCREARDRVRAAILTSQLPWPDGRVTVNLAPTHLRKVGSGLDLPIAVAVLVALGHLREASVRDLGLVGELGLDGTVRPVVGLLPLLDALDGHQVVVPAASRAEARLARPDARTVASMTELVGVLRDGDPWPEHSVAHRGAAPRPSEPDLSDVRGHPVARAALEVAAAGGHHVLMTGPPGAGKTMLARRLPGILPDLGPEQAMSVSRIHSCAGQLRADAGLAVRPPFRAPHHTASLVALVGGGSVQIRPGEVSLASGGVLFLDELGEFPAGHLDALRQPLEDGVIRIARAGMRVELPARVLLVAATNPCPCGAAGGECTCTPSQVARYLRRLSGPLLDRFDVHLSVQPPRPEDVFAPRGGAEGSGVVRERVRRARARAARRGVTVNRELSGPALDRHAPLEVGARELLRARLADGTLSMRGVERTRALALTLADLAGRDGPLDAASVSQALSLRSSRRPEGARR